MVSSERLRTRVQVFPEPVMSRWDEKSPRLASVGFGVVVGFAGGSVGRVCLADVASQGVHVALEVSPGAGGGVDFLV